MRLLAVRLQKFDSLSGAYELRFDVAPSKWSAQSSVR